MIAPKGGQGATTITATLALLAAAYGSQRVRFVSDDAAAILGDPHGRPEPWDVSDGHRQLAAAANVLVGVPLSVPQPDRGGSAVPQAFASPSATSGDQWRCRPDRNPGGTGGRLAGSWHEGCAPPFTRAFTSPSP